MIAVLILALIWVALTAYILLAGADFGAGFWDLLAGTSEKGKDRRALIEHSIGPVWEANHVWLIFVLVLAWTAFPPLFASVASTLYVPLSLVAIGIIFRGSAFAFRKVVTELWQQRLFGAAFAISSVVTPFFLGAIAGALVSGRVPPGVAAGNVITSWLNPTSVVTGLLTIAITAYLAATYLTNDARHQADSVLPDYFRRRALLAGIAVAILAAAALITVSIDAPAVSAHLTGRALLLLLISIAAGVVSLVLLFLRHYVAVRLTAALAVTAILWAWGIAQYPELLPGLSVQHASALPATLLAVAVSSGVGMVLLVPSFIFLFTLFQTPRRPDSAVREKAVRG